MSFTNPLNAGQTLILGSLHSPNYVADVSGWSINKNGTAQFNSVTIIGDRITLKATGGDGDTTIQANTISMKPSSVGGKSWSDHTVIGASGLSSGDSTVTISDVIANSDTGNPPSLQLNKTFGTNTSKITMSATNTETTGDLITDGILNSKNLIFYSFAIATASATGTTQVVVDTTGVQTFKAGHFYRFVFQGHCQCATSTSIIPQFFLLDTALGGTVRGFASVNGAAGSNDTYFNVEMWVTNNTATNINRTMVWSLRSSAAGNTALHNNPGGFPAPLMWYCEDHGTDYPGSLNFAPLWATAL